MSETQEKAAVAGYETQDVSGRAMAWFYILFLIAVALMTAAVGGVYAFMVDYVDAKVAPVWNVIPSLPVPPAPRLEIAPHVDLHAFQHAESEWLRSYGWTDAAHGWARIPVDEAESTVLSQRLIPYAPLPGAPGALPSGAVITVPDSGPVGPPAPLQPPRMETSFPPGSTRFAPEWTERENQGRAKEEKP